MHIPNPPNEEDYSSEGESFDEEIIPQFNPATSMPPSFDEDEWRSGFGSILDIPTIFNPATQEIADIDED